MLSAKDFDKWFEENQTEGLKFANYTNLVVTATMCYHAGVLDGLFEQMNERQINERYDIMTEILGALRTFEPEELEAIWKYCNNYHRAYRQQGRKHIITEITVESDNKA